MAPLAGAGLLGVCVTDRCRRDEPGRTTVTTRTSTTMLPARHFHTPSTSTTFQLVLEQHPDHPDHRDWDSGDRQLIRFDDDDEDELESSGTRPRRPRPQTGSPSLTGSSILRSDDVRVVDDGGRPVRVFPAPPVHTTSGGRGHQRHVVSVTSSSTSGSGVARLPVVTSFLAAAAAAAASFHRTATSTVW